MNFPKLVKLWMKRGWPVELVGWKGDRSTAYNQFSEQPLFSTRDMDGVEEILFRKNRDRDLEKDLPKKTLAEAAMVKEVAKKACSICLEKESSVTFAPCGHKKCCEDCARIMMSSVVKFTCPFCKKPVESVVNKVFE